MPEIVLLAGTETVPFADVPQLFAKAIYPEVPEDAPYTVTGLRKFPLSVRKTLKWCGEGRPPRSVTCTDKDMVQLRTKFWSHLPKLELPIDGDKWKPYWDAYEENPPQDWQLKMEMNNPRNDWFAKFCITVAEYETQLKKAFSDGSLTVHSALTHLPLLQSTSDSLRLAGFITVNALREFAAKSQIDIRVVCDENAVAQATAPAESKRQSETGDKCNDSKPASVESNPPNEADNESNKRTTQTVTTRRSDALTAVIATAMGQALDSADYHSVWAELVKLASSPNRPAPLLGFAEGEGVKYQGDDDVEFFKKNNLRNRMQRAAR